MITLVTYIILLNSGMVSGTKFQDVENLLEDVSNLLNKKVQISDCTLISIG